MTVKKCVCNACVYSRLYLERSGRMALKKGFEITAGPYRAGRAIVHRSEVIIILWKGKSLRPSSDLAPTWIVSARPPRGNGV